MKASTTGRNFLVLWRWMEALNVEGAVMTGAEGRHADGLRRGDRMFVWAIHGKELYLLGAIFVERGGDYSAEGRSLYGPFQKVPLKGLKWRLRFQKSASDRLTPNIGLALQVRSRRRPTAESVKLLEKILSDQTKRREERLRALEGKLKDLHGTTRERKRDVRINALVHRGTCCEICDFDFAKRYGEDYRACVEVHHLSGISAARKNGVVTTLDDVIVICPNCHRALHQRKHVGDWKSFRRAYRRRLNSSK